MPLSFFFDLSLIILSISILHLANKVFNIKLRILTKFTNANTYRATIVLGAVFIWMIFCFTLDTHFTTSTFGQIVILSSLYLANVPNDNN